MFERTGSCPIRDSRICDSRFSIKDCSCLPIGDFRFPISDWGLTIGDW
jgi:hypothetical protein